MKNAKNLMRSKTSFIWIVALITLQLNTFAQDEIVGSYKGEDSFKTLHLNNNGRFYFLSLHNHNVYDNIDTLSYGSWRTKNNFLILNTPKTIESEFLNMQIEKSNILDSDSLTIEINNPYETYQAKRGGNRLFNYVAFISWKDYLSSSFIKFKSNRYSVLKSKVKGIIYITLKIIPDTYEYPSKIAFNFLKTESYYISCTESNYYKLFLPDLTMEYIGYVRFKEEYVKTDGNTLLLRGEKYVKQ